MKKIKRDKIIAIILAGGLGTRFNSNIPKQLLKLNKDPIIIHTLKVFEKCNLIEEIVVVIHREWLDYFKKLLKGYCFKKVNHIIEGGATRQESSFNALKYLEKNRIAKENDVIVIHDATRPFVTEDIIKRNIENCKIYGAVDTAVKTIDTIIVVDNKGFIKEIPNRDYLYNGQTPQTFRFGIILKAHKMAIKENYKATDDCSLVLKIGHKVKVVEGKYENIKITTPFDMNIARLIIKNKKN